MVLETTKTDGIVAIPCVIYPYKRSLPPAILVELSTLFCSGVLTSSWMARVSESGWMTSEHFSNF